MYNSQEMESTNMFINRKLRTNWHNPTWEYYSAIKHNKMMALAAVWMHQDIIILSEVGQNEKDKYHKISWMELKKCQGRGII